MIYYSAFILLFILEIAYIKLADRFNIIDKPNQRSLHSMVTIRGGGIIFVVGALIYFFYSNFQYAYFFAGLMFISIISFLDDIFTIPNRYRIIVQFVSVFLLLKDVVGNGQVGFWLLLLIIVLVGIMNAFNFMDGINGITGGYSLINMISLLFVNNYHTKFIDNEFIIFVSFSLVVFNFFNFRKSAKCFAGDIGSISIAFILIFLLVKLIMKSNEYVYILFLCVYGIDSIFTIIFRFWNGENIFIAHNKHLFQLLVRNGKLKHLEVSIIYISFQFMINFLVVYMILNRQTSIMHPLYILLISIFLYLFVRYKFSNQQTPFNKK